MSEEHSEHTLVLIVDGEEIGVTNDLGKAERVLVEHWKSDYNYSDADIAEAEVLVDLKFSQWVLRVNKIFDYTYYAVRVPVL